LPLGNFQKERILFEYLYEPYPAAAVLT